MPEVKGGKSKSNGAAKGKGGKKPTPGRDAAIKQTADASSIVMGVFLIIALIVGLAAWMGGSMSVVSGTANSLTDGFVRSIGLSVKTIRVYEATPDQEIRIRNAMGVAEGDSMFRADPNTIKVRLDSLKGLGEVQVHRFWPDQISVFAPPLEATVLYWDGEKHIAMDPHGGEVPHIDIANASFPVITGKGAVLASAELLADLEEFPTLKSRLSYSERIGDRRWDLIMMTGVRVKLPSEDEARYSALNTLQALQRETGALDRNVSTIDLRDEAYVYVQRPPNITSNLASGGARHG